MTAAAADKPLEKSSGDDDARKKPAPPRPRTARSRTTASPTSLLAATAGQRRSEKAAERSPAVKGETPYAEASPAGEHAETPSMAAETNNLRRPYGAAPRHQKAAQPRPLQAENSSSKLEHHPLATKAGREEQSEPPQHQQEGTGLIHRESRGRAAAAAHSDHQSR
jgi:hypothetical protein